MSNLRRRKAGGADAAAPAAGAAAGVAKEKRIGPLIAAVVLGGGALVLADRQHGLGAEQKLQGVLLLTAVAIAVLFATCPPLPQPLAYHNFADQRCLCCGVPNTFDVLSNIPFLLVSALGLDHVMGGRILAAAGVEPGNGRAHDLLRGRACDDYLVRVAAGVGLSLSRHLGDALDVH